MLLNISTSNIFYEIVYKKFARYLLVYLIYGRGEKFNV
jgi:hypothetical protein